MARKKRLLARLHKQMKNGHSFTHEMIKLGFSPNNCYSGKFSFKRGGINRMFAAIDDLKSLEK